MELFTVSYIADAYIRQAIDLGKSFYRFIILIVGQNCIRGCPKDFIRGFSNCYKFVKWKVVAPLAYTGILA